MGRHRPIPSTDEWRVITNGVGQWLIVDQDGQEPLRHPDRITRLHAIYLAAQAPPLAVAVQELVRTVSYLQSGYHHFTPLLEFASMTLSFTKPPAAIVAQEIPLREQGDLDLEAA